MHRLPTLLLALLLWTGCGSTPAPQPAPTDEVGYTGDELWWATLGTLAPEDEQAPPARQLTGLDALSRMLEVSHLMRRKADVDPQLWKLVEATTERLNQGTLREFHEVLPADEEADRTKRLWVVARRPTDDEQAGHRMTLERSAPDLSRPGDYTIELAMRPLEDEAVRLESTTWIQTGGPTPIAQVRWLTAQLAWAERAARAADGPLKSRGALRREDSAVLGRLRATFPRSYPLAEELIKIVDVAWLDQRRGQPVTQAQIVIEPNLEVMRERYPKIHEYVVRTKTTRSTRFELEDERGRPLASLHYDGPALQIRARAALRDGALLPLVGDDLEPGLRLDRLGTQRALLKLSIEVNYWGLEVTLADWRIPVTLELSPERWQVTYHVREAPQVIKVEGAVLGMLPVWMVEALMPSRLEVMLRGFLTRLLRGDGLELGFSFERRDGRTVYATRFKGELADNGWLRVNANLVGRRLAPRKRARSEIGDVSRGLIEALRADIAEARERVEPADPTER